mmetsp:Transcript_34857/g.109023  ORF Transcript_34857/g.109023 Transcript_34857/m.109023 type:complete len:336 (-) Transcript_34857:1189-2196(-)
MPSHLPHQVEVEVLLQPVPQPCERVHTSLCENGDQWVVSSPCRLHHVLSEELHTVPALGVVHVNRVHSRGGPGAVPAKMPLLLQHHYASSSIQQRQSRRQPGQTSSDHNRVDCIRDSSTDLAAHQCRFLGVTCRVLQEALAVEGGVVLGKQEQRFVLDQQPVDHRVLSARVNRSFPRLGGDSRQREVQEVVRFLRWDGTYGRTSCWRPRASWRRSRRGRGGGDLRRGSRLVHDLLVEHISLVEQLMLIELGGKARDRNDRVRELVQGVEERDELRPGERGRDELLRDEEDLEGSPQPQQLELPMQLALLARDAVHDLGDIVEHSLELALEGLLDL